MKKITLMLVAAVCFAMLSVSVSAQSDKEIADAVIKMAKAQWAWEDANPGKAYEKDIAEDYTEFNPGFPVRLDSRAMAAQAYVATTNQGDRGTMSEMTNVKVQVYNGDTAILTYNFIGATKNAEGQTTPNLAKSTRVYVKTGGGWKLVHANFAPVTLPN